MWSDLILGFAKSKQIYSIALNELYQSQICCNVEINRRLSMENILLVSEWMQKNSKKKNMFKCFRICRIH
jgi:hypothetical protein